MASSPSNRQYDVFLSFRGEDTRKQIVSHLYSGFKSKGILTFKDDRELQTGDSLSNELPRAIDESKFAVVVISQNYGSSRWCLDELQMIMEHHKKGILKVIPIFYEVNPSDVRKQRGPFAEAFERHEVTEKPEKVEKWRAALVEVANVTGVDSRTCQDEANMVGNIVRDISNRLFSMIPKDTSDIIGMDTHLEALVPLLSMGSGDEVRMIGIWGMGGIGKTTIAKCLYDDLKCQFPFHCFMGNVKKISDEQGLEHLQGRFLSDMLHEENLKFESLEMGSNAIKKRLHRQKVLAILDDIDQLEQLHALARESSWFGPGSRIIITTRDKGLLISHNTKLVYEVKCLGRDVALKLFKHFAFGERHLSDRFRELSISASNLVQGLPLALKVFGSYLCGRQIEDWEVAIQKLKGDPCRIVMGSLKVSYYGLGERDKGIFLSVACLFNEEHDSCVAQLLDDEEEEVNCSLKMLAEKSLIDISNDGHMMVHDLIQEMAKEIVYEQSPNDPGRRRFLWDAKEIYNVLEDGLGTNAIEGILLNMSEIPKCPTRNGAFENMRNLKFLKIYNSYICREDLSQILGAFNYLPRRLRLLDWSHCPLTTLPSGFRAECLVELRLPYSKLERLSEGTLFLQNLRRMNLEVCRHPEEIPSLSRATKLEELDLSGCDNLVEVPLSLISLEKLTVLSMEYCSKLQLFPSATGLKSLKVFNLRGCWSLKSFPELPVSIVELYLNGTKITEVPYSIQNLVALEILNLSNCRMLSEISSMIGNLTALKELDLSGCENIRYLPDTIGSLTALETLTLEDCRMLSEIPNSIGNLRALKCLDVQNCRELRNIPKTIWSLTALETLTLSSCKMLYEIPSMIENSDSLKFLSPPEDIVCIWKVLDAFCYRKQHFNFLNLDTDFIDFLHLEPNMEAYLERTPRKQALEVLCLKGKNSFWDYKPLHCTSLSIFRHLRELSLCNLNILEIPNDLGCLQALQSLDMSRNSFEIIPASIKELSLLERLILNNCKKIRSMPELPPSLKNLHANGCSSLESISNICRHPFQELLLSKCFKLGEYPQSFIQHMIDSMPLRKEEVKSWVCFSASALPDCFYNQSREKD